MIILDDNNRKIPVVIRNNSYRVHMIFEIMITKNPDKANEFAKKYFNDIFKQNPTFGEYIKGIDS